MSHCKHQAGRATKSRIWSTASLRAGLGLAYCVGLILTLMFGHSEGGADSPRSTPPPPSGPCQSTSAMVAIPGAGTVQVQCKWETLLPGDVVQSSPNLALLDESGPSIVVGTRDTGQVFALHLSDGSSVAGWPVSTGHAVDSSPTVVPDPSNSGLDDVVVDAGDVTAGPPPSLQVDTGELADYGPGGDTLWSRDLPDEFGAFGSDPAVFASPTAAQLSPTGPPSLVMGGVSLSQYALDSTDGAPDPGWPRKTADSTFSTAAVANLDGTGPEIIAGSDSSTGPGALDSWNGGVVRAQGPDGSTLWSYRTDEVVTSSPAIGDLDGTGNKVVFGHGSYWAGIEPTSDSTTVTALNADGSTDWQTSLGGFTPASPALADLNGDGELDVVEPTWQTSHEASGVVYALDPQGQIMWGPVYQSPLPGELWAPDNLIYGGVATADFGEGYQDVVYASAFGWNILDGRTGEPLLPFPTASANNVDGEWVDWDGTVANLAMSNTPLVVPDPEGGIDIVLSGVYAPSDPSGDHGFVAVYRVHSSDNTTDEAGAWPMFHHDPQHTGFADTSSVQCQGCMIRDPKSGYWLAAADGGVFTYGDAQFYGSMGGLPLAAPIVGMAATPDGHGYWLAAADGGVFTYGDAQFYGSMGGVHLAAPIVGMAPTPDGHGYWLVAADGGVFTFGDARFYGSMGGVHLAAPIVGMAATTDFPGYWLVAADGGVFTFGDAVFHGSMGGVHLAAPVVGITATPGDGGYWLVAADGGVFTFGQAPYEGSLGGDPIAAPVKALVAVPAELGSGYWLVAKDGGVFTYGQAAYDGSMGGAHLAARVVAMASLP